MIFNFGDGSNEDDDLQAAIRASLED